MTRAVLLSLLALTSALAPTGAGQPAQVGPGTTLEVALGRHGREQHEKRLSQRTYGERSFAWKDYAGWGRELLVKGSVEKPPVGPAPSPRLSTNYRCVHCHNLSREDQQLTRPGPGAREELVRTSPAPARRDGSGVALMPGTTLWGAVNRTRFYNDYYSKYDTLKIADGSVMNPERLADALQICSRYCSAGRFPEAWELDSMLAFLWELELKLSDLDLDEATLRKVTSALAGQDGAALEEARGVLRSSHLTVARATLLPKVKDVDGDSDVYPDRREAGDAKRGEVLYRASCAGCHGQDVEAPEAPKIARRARGDTNFHRAPTRGTDRFGRLYMPLFAAERMTTKQLADIRVFLASPGEKK